MKFMQNSQPFHYPNEEVMPRRITILFFDAGGGHRNATEALKTTLQEHAWDVHLLNVQELLDSIDLFEASPVYEFKMVTPYPAQRMDPAFSSAVAAPPADDKNAAQAYRQLLHDYWSLHPTDLVLSVIPISTARSRRVCGWPCRKFHLLPYSPIFADYPPHFWMEKRIGISYLRNSACQTASFRDGPCVREGLRSLRHDPEAEVLSETGD